MENFDVVIRGGTVIDGSGGAPVQADVGLIGERIAAIGANLVAGRQEIDARGLLVTPGFVDVHTHYDGQATWDSRLWPSSLQGVTTAVMGNCGVGFAPCRPADRLTLIELMEGVEDIPGSALAEGLPWNWESFPQFLDALAGRPRDIDIAALLPHGALRVFVMGDRAVRREAATADDVRAMQALVVAALDAGAVGLSTSRTSAHRTVRGELTPMFDAEAAELVALGQALAGRPGAVFQMISDFGEPEAEFEILTRICRDTSCQGTLTVVRVNHKPQQHEQLLQMISAANAQGLRITGQVIARPVGVLMGFDTTLNPFSCRPAYAALAPLPLAERLAQLARPDVRQTILTQDDHEPHVFMRYYGRRFDNMFALCDGPSGLPNYLPQADQSVQALAAKALREPAEWLYDHCLGEAGSALIYLPLANYLDCDAGPIEAMLKHPHTVPGLGDGGAHVGTICDGSAGTFLLTEWVRQRGVFSIEAAIHLLTQRSAQLYGLHDRGLLAPGLRADINLIDLQQLAILRPHLVHDLPAGGRRFLQGARGYHTTLVAGQVTYRDGDATERLPGRLVRRGQAIQSDITV